MHPGTAESSIWAADRLLGSHRDEPSVLGTGHQDVPTRPSNAARDTVVDTRLAGWREFSALGTFRRPKTPWICAVGIYLAVYALSDATIERLHADPPLAWRVMDPETPEREAESRAERQPRPGLFARLFKGAKVEPPPPSPPLQLAPGEGDLGPDGDFEKSWHGLHYLLTGTSSEGEPPLNFLMGGGRELELVDGDTPLLTHSSSDTRRIADALSQLSEEEVRARANPAEFKRLEVYPEVWDDPKSLEYLLEDFRRLRATVTAVANRGLGLLVSIQ
jgi:Domain of unknown function (DUF1877)